MDARVVTEQPGPRPRAVIFRDSFGSAMIPFLSEHFSRAVYVWQNDLDPALVLQERPTVVIQEWVGRHLHTAAPYDAVAAWRGGAPAVEAHRVGGRRTFSNNAPGRRGARAAGAAPRNAPRPRPGRTVS